MRCHIHGTDMTEWQNVETLDKYWICGTCFRESLDEQERMIERDRLVYGTGFGLLVDGVLRHLPVCQVLVFTRDSEQGPIQIGMTSKRNT